LLVIQTLSKSRSLAGLRVGFALGQEDLIEGLDRVKNSFNSYTLDRLALAGAVAAIKDEDYFQETRQKVINTRERFSEELVRIGFEVVPSKANFVFISHPKIQASNLFMKLREKGILVRHFNKPRIDNYLRVSIGTDKDIDSVLMVLKEICTNFG
jgi:histidinol-phosphate aminotransferase